MQEIRRKRKTRYFNTCKLSIKLIHSIIFCCLFLSCAANDAKQVLPAENDVTISETAININTASIKELEKLPHIGEKTAREIVEHREKFGRFRKPEHLMLVRGVSDERFREIKKFVRTE